MKLQFSKMTGAGNDFIVIDNRRSIISDRALAARKLCDRSFGIGADGLLLVEQSVRADYKMLYYNADGSYGGMCGNGGRCIALYTLKNKIARQRQKFEALNFVYHARVSGTEVTLRMKDPQKIERNIVLRVDDQPMKLSYIDTGSPHVVTVLGQPFKKNKLLEKINVSGIGSQLRYNPRFSPRGTNVNFIQIVSSKTIKMRTYERGVEAETIACGTGSIASAIISSSEYGLKPPITVITKSLMKLVVNFRVNRDRISDVTLKGPAELVYKGQIDF